MKQKHLEKEEQHRKQREEEELRQQKEKELLQQKEQQELVQQERAQEQLRKQDQVMVKPELKSEPGVMKTENRPKDLLR